MDASPQRPAPPPPQAPGLARHSILAGNDTPVLQRVMQWVGAGRWLYMASVSRPFCQAYLAAHSGGAEAAQRTSLAAAAATVDMLVFALTELKGWLEQRQEQRESVLKALGRAVGARGCLDVFECATGAELRCECADVLLGAAAALRPAMVEAVCEAMQSVLHSPAGDLALLEAALVAARSGDDGRCLTALTLARRRAQQESFVSCEWPLDFGGCVCAVAAAAGNVDTMRWLLEGDYDELSFFDSYIFLKSDPVRSFTDLQAQCGPAVAALVEEYAPWVGDTPAGGQLVAAAAGGGSAHMVRYVCSARHGGDRAGTISPSALIDALRGGTERHLEAAKEVLAADAVCHQRSRHDLVIGMAGLPGVPVELFEWARRRGIGTWSERTMGAMLGLAQAEGNGPLVGWLTEQLAQLGA